MNIRIPTLLLLTSLTFVSISARELAEPDLSSDEFVKRFTASYGILAEKEPPLSDIEIVMLKKIAPMMRVDKDAAKGFLQSMTVGEEEHSASFNYLLGNVYFESDEYLLAEEQFKTAIDLFPSFQRAWTNLGVLKLRSGDTKSALIAFLKAVELGDSTAHTYGMLGYCHFTEGNYISAEVAYDRAMLAQPDNLDWLEGKAQVYFQAERYLEAIRMHDELISRRPYNLEYWLAQTNAYLANNELEQTARNLEIVHSLGGGDFDTRFLLGNLYTKLNMHGPSGEAYLAAANFADPDNVEFMVSSAKQLFFTKQYIPARKLFSRIDPELRNVEAKLQFEYKMLKGDFLQLDGENQKAISIFEEAELLDPLDGVVLIKLAKLHNIAGNRDKAYFLLDRAEEDPKAEFDALLARVKFLIEEERFEESQLYVGRALKIRSSESIQNLYQQVEQAARDRG